MPSAAILPHEIQIRRSNRRWQLAEKRNDRLQVSAALHHEAKGRRLTTDPLCRETRVRASRIRRNDDDFDVPEARGLSGAGHRPRQGKSLVADDTQRLKLHQRSAPGNRFGGYGGLVPPPPLREGGQCRLGALELASPGRAGTRNTSPRPYQQQGSDKSGDDPGNQRVRRQGASRPETERGHQFFGAPRTPRDSWNRTSAAGPSGSRSVYCNWSRRSESTDTRSGSSR